MGGYLRRRRRWVLLQAALATGSFTFLALRVDLPRAVEQLTEVRLGWAVAGLVAFTLSKAIHSYRWRVLLRHRSGLRGRDLFPVFLVSNLANAVVPLRAGDVLRVELTRRRFGIPRAELTSSVFLVESVLDGVAFVALLLPALLLLDPGALRTPTAALIGAVVLGAFAASLLIARLEVGVAVDRWRLVGWLPPALRGPRRRDRPLVHERDARAARRPGDGDRDRPLRRRVDGRGRRLLDDGPGLRAGDGVLGGGVLVTIAANVIVSLPLTPWDIGPYEVAVTEALAFMGFGLSEAGAYAVGSHLLLIVWISITGVAAMWTLHVGPRDLLAPRSDDAAEDAEPSQVPERG